MKRLFLLASTLGLCSLATAQFRERPATTALRASRLATHVEGNLRKIFNFAVDGRVVAVSFSPEGDYLAVATATTLSLFNESGARKLLIWDGTKEPGALFEDRPPTNAVLTFSADGKTLFFCGPRGLDVWTWPTNVSLDQSPRRVWTDAGVYNLALAGENRLVCAVKKGSSHHVQLRDANDGKIAWEKRSGLLAITSLRSSGSTVRSFVGTLSGSQCFWSDWELADGRQSLPVDMGALSGFSVSQSPDGKSAAVVNGDLSIITLETGETKVATAPDHPYSYYYSDYPFYWPYRLYRWHEDLTVDAGWTTLFSPDGNYVVTLGKEAVFYEKSSGVIVARIYYSDDPFPSPGTTQAETDGIGAFSPDGQKFALVRQGRVFYSLVLANGDYGVTRQVRGDSGVEIYELG